MTRKNNTKIISVVHPICCGPQKRIRQIRELVTLRKSYTRSLADDKRRVHKLFETANIKIGSVISEMKRR